MRTSNPKFHVAKQLDKLIMNILINVIHDSRGIIHTINMWQVPFNNTDGLDFADVKHLDSYLMTDFDRIHPFEC